MAKKAENPKQPTTLVCEPSGRDLKSKTDLLKCSLQIGTQPSKHLAEPVQLLVKGKYFKERSLLHKFLDFLAAISLAAVAVALFYVLMPRHTPDYIQVDANIAPKEVVTGGNSTLTFRFENQSKEELQNVRIRFEFPEYFLVDNIESADAQEVAAQEFDLGPILPTDYGFIHVTGTMFGNVGGEQVFTTFLTYNYGKDGEKYDEKRIEHVFTPTASTLKLALHLPEHMVTYQQVTGSITYSNTGDVNFPDMKIEPQWPENFDLQESSVPLTDGAFHVTPIKAGETGVIEFIGRLGTEKDSTFYFTPSFKFGEDSFSQEMLVDTVVILPPPLTVAHSVQETTLEPGDAMHVEMNYENTSDHPITDAKFRVEVKPDILAHSDIKGGSYSGGYYYLDAPNEIPAGEANTLTLTIPVPRTISRTGLETLSNIKVYTTSSAEFNFTVGNEMAVANTFDTTQTELLVSSPMILHSFARYYTPSGDQLGRGPLPPLLGETTKYWIFWNISGTTNDISSVTIEADLAPGVSFTGRQSVSIGSSVTQSGNSVSWSVSHIGPTLPTGSTIAGAAFEVAITPSEAQIGTQPALLQSARITARDDFTGAFVSASSSTVTTLLPQDSKGASYGTVVEK